MVPKPDNNTDEAMRVIKRTRLCDRERRRQDLCQTQAGAARLLVIGRGVRVLALVHLTVASEVGDDREVATTSLNVASERCLELANLHATCRIGFETYAFRQCGCTCGSEESWDE